MKFGVDSSGNYGYIKAGADTVIPFKTERNSEKCITICNYDSRGDYKGFLYNSIRFYDAQTIDINAYACNNVARVTHIVVVLNTTVLIDSDITASNMVQGNAPSPAPSTNYAGLVSKSSISCQEGDILKFGINCDTSGKSLSSYTGYYYGLFQVYTDM